MTAVVSPALELTSVELTPLIGSEIRVGRDALLSGQFTKPIRELLERRGVLVVRGADLDDDQQKAFTETLGELLPQKLPHATKDVMSISLDEKVNKRVADYLEATTYWHIDLLHTPLPNLATLLTPRQLSTEGGQTEFANTYAAWDAIPEDEKTQYEGLRVMHALEASQLMVAPEPSLAELDEWRQQSCHEQPLVWTHRSGRKSLVVGGTALYVVGKSPEESRYILTKLRDWATQPQFVYHHEWRMGDLLMWDNTGTMHRVLRYAKDSGRRLSRTVLKGEESAV